MATFIFSRGNIFFYVNKITIPDLMSDVLLSKLSTELADLDGEIGQIDQQISQLRRKKSELTQKRQAIERKIELKTNEDSDVVTDRWDRDGFPWSDEATKILKEQFHLEKFRPLQRAAINAVMSKEDAVVILSTGGGKSLCYQLPALLANGLALVVSPLISLVEDQILQLRSLGIDSSSLNANTSKEEAKRVEDAITNKDSKFRLLYVTPEKLAKSKKMMNKLEKSLSVGFLKLIAIDEVHCCSQWGHDFRTDYSFLNVLKRQFKGVPILGLTATATSNVLDDVKDMLGIQAALTFRAGFNRSNLKYKVVQKPGSEDECTEEIAKTIKRDFAGQTGIIYCLSRNDCEKVAKALKSHGIKAKHYHAYMEPVDRSGAHQGWISGKIQVIVATVAFGMGIDKPNVRFVIHHSLPKSIENYYQESGRAGRDGQPATCILYYRLADIFKQSSMVQQERTGIQNLYNMVRYAADSSTCRRVKLAEHFEEAWEPSWCQKQCDTCENGNGFVGTSSKESTDVSEAAKTTVRIIEEHLNSAKDGSGRITGNKLVELLTKKLKGSRNREFCEKLIVNLLLEGYLQEDFHYTVYSVISYVVIGSKWRVYNGKDAIKMRHVEESKSRKRKASSSVEEEDVMVLD
ncbi:Putative ATP-dependent DNA helicase Q1 [Caenorhabditis elegans]|uniref:Putative ATP-dependent DNA helicase Q1 n=2 Tax=Caenorhabditis elegans TaxID=6239 RepID=RECQ1_CAEEL|nr:Putative ATP-dependent DNA helicase Q1 [Caenorhabditis elegans]Q9TXJ8.3 RecName: Full=Putative ATP-dependent DNA helicase Q1 [Caenorhabditis elegans]CCD61879.1 Putative ATP-dependent DNA helicase Q1 [Caenorhabditis elegans]|eukprot:NP_001022656.1 Putative ATP-dependent DNA helicase Q1 [Caenorhabditis elegans]